MGFKKLEFISVCEIYCINYKFIKIKRVEKYSRMKRCRLEQNYVFH